MEKINKDKKNRNNPKKQVLSRTGEDICKVCGAKIPPDSPVCIICNTPRGQHATKDTLEPSPEQPAKLQPMLSAQVLHHDRTRLKHWSVILTLFLILGGVLTFVIEYTTYSLLVSQYTTQNSFLYQQDGNSLKIKISNLAQPLTITDDYQSENPSLFAKESQNHRTLAYLNNQQSWNKGYAGELYLLNMIYLSEDYSTQEGSIKITDSLVVDFVFAASGNQLVFLTIDGDLFLCDYGAFISPLSTDHFSITLLDTEVSGIGPVLQNQLLYYKGTNATPTTLSDNQQRTTGSSVDLYYLAFDSLLDSPTLVERDVYSIVDVSPNLTHLLYTKRTQGAPKSLFNVYDFPIQTGENQLLVENVAKIVSADAATQQIIYLTPNTQTLVFSDLYEDDLTASDAALTDPNALSSQVDSDLPEELPETTPSEEGETLTLTEELQLERQKNYSDKLVRDQFRNYVNSQLSVYQQNEFVSFQLCYYNAANVETLVLSQQILNSDTLDQLVKGGIKDGYILFVSSSPISETTKKISEIPVDTMKELMLSPLPLQEELHNILPEFLIYNSTTLWEPLTLFTEPGPKSISQYSVHKETKTCYFITKNSAYEPVGTLYSIKEDETTSDRVIYIDDSVNGYVGVAGAPIAGLFYQSSSVDELPERNLYWYQNGDVWEIDTKTALYSTAKIVGNNPSTFLYFKDWNEDNLSGNLYGFSGEDSYLVSQGISKIIYSEGSNIYLLGSKNDTGAYRNLAMYQNGEVVLVDTSINDYHYFFTSTKS